MKKSTRKFPFNKIIITLLCISLLVSIGFSFKIYNYYLDANDLLQYFEGENDLLRFSLSEANGTVNDLSSEIDHSKDIESQFYEYEYLYDEAQVKYEMLKIDYNLLENYKFEANKKIAYLTFDDGPSNETLEMLKILKQYDVKATFFVNNGANAVIKEISNQGHLLANHTSSHQYNNLYVSTETFKSDILKLQETVYDLTGQTTNIFRFPGGSNTGYIKKVTGSSDITHFKEALTEMGYIYFDWNVDSGDARGKNVSTSTIANNVLDQCMGKREAVILMHTLDSKHTTTLALPLIIEGLLEQGFSFAILSNKTAPIRFID
ncbi:MAG: polysaccharide deacetylase family protein [Clostridiales bacterium]|jgi:peptidoglycan/xylan/chitin deacetylase (PgdA/CDA1 family)|nr:polysaccharide deacetylase family protein [Clostridiales bacterium]